MTPFRRSADAEAFDAALRGADAAPGHEPLLAAVASLREAADEGPRPDFSRALRERLVAEAAEVLEPRTVPTATIEPSRGARRRLAGVVATAVTLAGGAGLVASSASALPGEVLYPVKRGTEQVQKSLRLSDGARGTFELQQASRRLDEVQELARRDGVRPAVVDEALAEFETAARAGTGHLLQAYADDREPATLQQVDRFVASTAPALEQLSTDLDGTGRDLVSRVQRLVEELTGTVESTCPTCLSRESRRLAEEVQRSVGGSAPRAAEPRERVVSGTVSGSAPASSGRHRPAPRVALPTTTVSSGTARDSEGRADARRGASSAPTEAPSLRDRIDQRRAEREQRAEERRAERERRAEERRERAEERREERRAERERRAEERRERAEERRSERRQRAEERRREREERWRRHVRNLR